MEWGNQTLKDVDILYSVCRSVDKSLFIHSPEMFQKIYDSRDLLDWLRSQPGDLDFQVFFIFIFFVEMKGNKSRWIKEKKRRIFIHLKFFLSLDISQLTKILAERNRISDG